MNRTPKVLLLSVFLAGCSGVGVHRDYDATFRFDGLTFYAWKPSAVKEMEGDLANNALLDRRVRSAVDAALERKGFRKVPPEGAADCLVAYHYAVERGEELSGSGASVGVGGGSGGFFGGVGIGVGSRRGEEEMETLAIDILLPAGGKLIWRGFTRQELVRHSDPEKSAAAVAKTVEKILSQFPPKAKAKKA